MRVVVLLLFLSGCTTLRRQQIYAGLAGAFIGGTIGNLVGKDASPNKDSVGLNQTIGTASGMAVGAAAGAALGTYFWNESPENKPLKNMILEKEIPTADIPQEEFFRPLRPKAGVVYPLKEEPVPSALKDKINKVGRVKIYEVPEFIEKLPDGREITHQSHKAWEYVIEEKEESQDLPSKSYAGEIGVK